MRDSSIQPAISGESCGGCPAAAASRRAFLRDVALGVAALLTAGASPSRALANSVREIQPDARERTLRMYALPAADSVSIDVESEVILARWQNRVYAFSLRCPHRGTRLEWLADERHIFCPKHKARFQANGHHDSGRGSRDLDRYSISRAGGSVAVDLAALHRADREPAAWQRAELIVG